MDAADRARFLDKLVEMQNAYIIWLIYWLYPD